MVGFLRWFRCGNYLVACRPLRGREFVAPSFPANVTIFSSLMVYLELPTPPSVISQEDNATQAVPELKWNLLSGIPPSRTRPSLLILSSAFDFLAIYYRLHLLRRPCLHDRFWGTNLEGGTCRSAKDDLLEFTEPVDSAVRGREKLFFMMFSGSQRVVGVGASIFHSSKKHLHRL
jgi:hypothetical protein